MIAARNIGAAIATVRQAVAQEDRAAVTMHALAARARLLNAQAVAGFTADEFRELVELALQPGASVPPGAAGEAVLAYLLAIRAGRNPVPVAFAVLERFDAKDEIGTVADWAREDAEREAARAAALRAELARRAAV